MKTVILISWFVVLFLKYLRATDCHRDLSTEVDPNSVSYIGGSCTWNFTAPMGQVIVLESIHFTLQGEVPQECGNGYIQTTGFPKIICPAFSGSIISRGKSIQLSLIIQSDDTIANVSLHFMAVQEYYFCDFSQEEQCTADIVTELMLEYGRNVPGLCLLPPSYASTGFVFLQSSVSNILIGPLDAGKYQIQISAGLPCTTGVTQLRVTSTCDDIYHIGTFYGNNITLFYVYYSCDVMSEITFEALGADGTIAIDFIHFIRYFETDSMPSVSSQNPENGITTNTPFEDTLVTSLSVSGSLIFTLVCVCVLVGVCLWRRKKLPVKDDPAGPNKTDVDNPYQPEVSFDNKSGQDLSYIEVPDGIKSVDKNHENNYITYPHENQASIDDQGHMIYNTAYASFEETSDRRLTKDK